LQSSFDLSKLSSSKRFLTQHFPPKKPINNHPFAHSSSLLKNEKSNVDTNTTINNSNSNTFPPSIFSTLPSIPYSHVNRNHLFPPTTSNNLFPTPSFNVPHFPLTDVSLLFPSSSSSSLTQNPQDTQSFVFPIRQRTIHKPSSPSSTDYQTSRKYDYYSVDEEGLFVNSVCALLGGVACLAIKYAGTNNDDVVKVIIHMAKTMLGVERRRVMKDEVRNRGSVMKEINNERKESEKFDKQLNGWNIFDLLCCDIVCKSREKGSVKKKKNGKRNESRKQVNKGLDTLFSFLLDCVEGVDDEIFDDEKSKIKEMNKEMEEIYSKEEKEIEKQQQQHGGVESHVKEFNSGANTPPPRELSIRDVGSIGRTVDRVQRHNQVVID
jgi:hypothetical protein